MNCDALTKAIEQIAKLKPKLDSALNEKDVRAGLKVQQELKLKIQEILESINFLRLQIGEKTYDFFVERLGGVEEFLKRVGMYETVGKTGAELADELKKSNGQIGPMTNYMLRERDFEVTEAGRIIPFIRLKLGELFGDDSPHNENDIINKTWVELGLDQLPHEFAPVFLLKKDNQMAKDAKFNIHSDIIHDSQGAPRRFTISYEGNNGIRILLFRPTHDRDLKYNPDSEWIFSLLPSKHSADKYKADKK